MLVPSILAFLGLGLCAFVALLVLRGALTATHPDTWRDRWDRTSFITFAWHELGRSLFFGFVAAVGVAPIAIAFFAGLDRFFFNVMFLTGMSWATFSITIFFVAVLATFVGFLRYELEHPDRNSIWAVAQFTIVALFSLPAAIFFQIYLMPNLATIVGLWFETLGLYAKVVQ